MQPEFQDFSHCAIHLLFVRTPFTEGRWCGEAESTTCHFAQKKTTFTPHYESTLSGHRKLYKKTTDFAVNWFGFLRTNIHRLGVGYQDGWSRNIRHFLFMVAFNSARRMVTLQF